MAAIALGVTLSAGLVFGSIATASAAAPVGGEPVPPIPVGTADNPYRVYYFGGTRQADQPSEVSVAEAHAFYPVQDFPGLTLGGVVQYPRELAPLIGTTALDDSVAHGQDAAMTLLDQDIVGDGANQVIVLVGVSQGAVVVQKVRPQVADAYPGVRVITVTYGDPTNAGGGLMTRVPINLPGLTMVRADESTGYTNTVAIEYEIMADAPDVGILQNPVAWANAVMGGIYHHHTYSYAMVEDPAKEKVRTTVFTDHDGDQSHDVDEPANTHTLIKTPDLPLTQPLRDFGMDTAKMDKVLKPIVDKGYQGNRTTDSVTPRTDQATVVSGKKVTPARTDAGVERRQRLTDKLAERREKRREAGSTVRESAKKTLRGPDDDDETKATND